MDKSEMINYEIRMIEDEKSRIYADEVESLFEKMVRNDILEEYQTITPKTVNDYWSQYLD